MKQCLRKEVMITIVVLVCMVGFYLLGSHPTNTGEGEDTGEGHTNVISTMSDLEIMTMENHPVLLGSIDAGQELWKGNIDRVGIYDSDQDSMMQGTEDTKMMELKGYGDSIKTIHLYFNRMKDTKVSLEEAIKITVSYLPWDILEQYYEPYTANRVSSVESPEENAVYYELMFTRKANTGEKLPYEIGAILTVYPDGTIESRIEENPEVLNLVMNGLEMSPWEITIKAYLD